jgi:hypothetical protein
MPFKILIWLEVTSLIVKAKVILKSSFPEARNRVLLIHNHQLILANDMLLNSQCLNIPLSKIILLTRAITAKLCRWVSLSRI